MTVAFTDGKGQPLRLGREIKRGGEGTVFDVAEHAELVAKIYHAPPEPAKADKLTAMVGGGSERLRKIAAWPSDTIHARTGGAVRGFVMRRVSRQNDIHVLYGPKTRLRDYPDATYRFLVHVAANLARAFAVVHDHGHVIGDVNQGGVCVASDGTLTLVDCDSFQIRGPQQVFACDVGIPIYQPPEHQRMRSFHGLARRANHDNFGLAVLIFQTLFLARHPFAGAFQGDGDMPIERAISELRFAYGRDAATRQMKQPPGSLGLGAVPPAVAELFERAFLEGGALGNRPTALEWITALDGFAGELRDCAHNPGHAYPRALTRCPLCEIEGRVGVLLFLPPRQAGSASGSPTVNLEQLWHEVTQAIASTRLPAPAASPPAPVQPVPMAIIRYGHAKHRALLALPVGGIACLLLATVSWQAALFGVWLVILLAVWLRGRMPAEARGIDAKLAAAHGHLTALVRHVERERTTSALPQLEARVTTLHDGLAEFPLRQRERLQHLARGRRERQLRKFLDQFEVKDARLKGFGAGLFAALISHGIETADDLTPEHLRGIAGFGPKRVAALLDWRRALEARFQFNPSDAADAGEHVRVERELQLEHGKELAEFRRLAEQIKATAKPMQQRIELLADELARAQQDVAAARAIAQALGKPA